MEINSAAQMRQAIIELAQRVDKIEEWQAMDAELAGGGGTAAPADGIQTEQNREKPSVEDIELLVATRITAWKYAVRTSRGTWTCPMNPSQLAASLGNATDWRILKALINDNATRWNRLRWYKAPPPKDWSPGRKGTAASMIQWVEVVA